MPNFAKDDVYVPPQEDFYANFPRVQGPPAPPTGNVWTQAANRIGPAPAYHPDVLGALRAFGKLNYNPRPAGLVPPATTGPVNSPQSYLRAKVAADYYLSDKARGLLSKTPISVNTVKSQRGEWGGVYNPAFPLTPANISIDTSYRPMSDTWNTQSLAHEFTHAWQDQQTPQMFWPSFSQALIDDTYRIAQGDSASGNAFKEATRAWNNDKPQYDKKLFSNPAMEVGARVVQYAKPEWMPEGFRSRYYPGMFGNVPLVEQPPYIDNSMTRIPASGGLPPSGRYR